MFDRRMKRQRREGWQERHEHERREHGGHHEHEERTERHEQHRHGPGHAFDERGGFPYWSAPGDRGPRGNRGHRHGPFGGGPGGPFGGGPGGPGGPFGERGRRQRRGDIKVALLELLGEQPRHGYDLIKELEQRSGGFYRPSPGSVYPTLQLLEDEGHVTSDTIDGKRVYTITDAGRALLEQYRERDTDPEQRKRGQRGQRGPWMDRMGRMGHDNQDLAALQESVMALGASVMQLARTGTPDQVKEAMGLLDSARRDIYAILARDTSAGKTE